MNSKFLLILIFSIFITPCIAENNEGGIPKGYPAINFGLNLSNDIGFSKKYKKDNSVYANINFGAAYNIPADKHTSLVVGIDYYKIGDHYYYYTGFNLETTKTTISLNLIKFSLSSQINLGKIKNDSSNIPFIRAGFSIDYAMGEPNINTERTLNNPDGFRSNISQGELVGKISTPLNFSFGIKLRSKQLLELGVSGFYSKYFSSSKYGNGKSNYFNTYLRYGFIIK